MKVKIQKLDKKQKVVDFFYFNDHSPAASMKPFRFRYASPRNAIYWILKLNEWIGFSPSVFFDKGVKSFWKGRTRVDQVENQVEGFNHLIFLN